MKRLLIVVAASFLVAAAADAPADDSPVFDIPQFNGVVVDGQPGDWADSGFLVEMPLRRCHGFSRSVCLCRSRHDAGLGGQA